MAASVRHRSLSMARLHSLRSALPSLMRSFASDALVELRPGEIGMVAGIPQEHLRRRVLIYSPARTATQQGSGKVGRWKINFLSTQKWENPLMGWTSTGDPYANVGDAALSFDSEEAAKAFAEKHGWDYVSFVSTLVNNTKLKKKKMMNLQADSENDERQIREFPKRKKELPETLCSLVKKRHTPILKVRAYADNFKWKGPPKSEEN